MGRRLLVIAGVVVALTAGGVWWFFLRDNAPPAAALQSCEGAIPGSAALRTDGRWQAGMSDSVFVGYRIDEQFGGDTLSRTVAGRTALVSGTMVLEEGTLTEVTVEGDLTGLTSDEPRRDAYLADHALVTDETPMATFTLTEPVALPDEAEAGQGVSVDVVGNLELHGVTQDVTVDVDACAIAENLIEVAGRAPIELADYDIEAPDIPGLVRVEDHGIMEFHVVFTRLP